MKDERCSRHSWWPTHILSPLPSRSTPVDIKLPDFEFMAGFCVFFCFAFCLQAWFAARQHAKSDGQFITPRNSPYPIIDVSQCISILSSISLSWDKSEMCVFGRTKLYPSTVVGCSIIAFYWLIPFPIIFLWYFTAISLISKLNYFHSILRFRVSFWWHSNYNYSISL